MINLLGNFTRKLEQQNLTYQTKLESVIIDQIDHNVPKLWKSIYQ